MTEVSLSRGEIDKIIRQLWARYAGEKDPDPLFPLRDQDIHALMRHITRDEPLPEIAQDWLSFCFWRAAEGESLDRLLGLVRKRGAPHKAEMHFAIAVDVLRLMREQRLSLDNAAFEIGEKYRLNERKVKECYSKYKLDAELELALEAWSKAGVPKKP